MRHKRHTQAEWAEILGEFETSGMTVEAFAEEKKVRARTLLWWRSAIKRPHARRPVPARIRMLPVRVREPDPISPASSQVEITFRAGTLRFPVGTNAEYIGALLLELRTSC